MHLWQDASCIHHQHGFQDGGLNSEKSKFFTDPNEEL